MYSPFVTASAKKSAKSQKSKLSREKTGGSEGTKKKVLSFTQCCSYGWHGNTMFCYIYRVCFIHKQNWKEMT